MSDTVLRSHKLKIYKPQVHLDIRKYFFSIRVIEEWNSLPVRLELINCNTILLLYASESWTLLAADVKTLEAFHMKCQRQILRIRWQDHVRNDEVAAHTGLRPVMESIRRRREAIFGHVARMSPNIPAHQALRLQVETSLGRRPDRDWVRSSGRPRNRWIDQLRQDHQRPPADLWRAAIQRGHTGATLRSSTTTR